MEPKAPTVTQEQVDAFIVSEEYVMLPSGKGMICELILRNGYSVVGKNAVVCKENFQVDLGKQYSRENAVQQVWPLLGFILQQNLYEAELTADQLRSFSLDDGCESGACKL